MYKSQVLRKIYFLILYWKIFLIRVNLIKLFSQKKIIDIKIKIFAEATEKIKLKKINNLDIVTYKLSLTQ